ncbi:hypothetical protein [Pseudomonas sp.]|uniref:hypothetical protein n=1 Tax=Pseudomonas sp. TaxID=306 RepID=UPI003FD84750
MTDQASKVSGNVSVPREPTGDQEEAGCQAYMKADGKNGPFSMHRSSRGHAYKAMIAAAPIDHPRETPFSEVEVEVLACASFAKRGNIQCWSLRRDHASLRKLEGEGQTIIELVDRTYTGRLQERVGQLKSTNKQFLKTIDMLNDVHHGRMAALQSDLTKARELLAGVCEYANGLLTEVNDAWAYAGSTGEKQLHKDSDYLESKALLANQSAPAATCKTCKGSGIEYDGAGHTCTACNGSKLAPSAKGDL